VVVDDTPYLNVYIHYLTRVVVPTVERGVMREHNSVITRKGQVTLPAEIRHRLGLKRGDKVSFRIESDQVLLTRGESVSAATEGIFKWYVDKPRTAEELRAAAEQAIADEERERSRS